MTRWRHALLLALAAGPLCAAAGTHTLGVDIGDAGTSGLRCPPAATGECKRDDDAVRVYYEFAPTETVGLRITHAFLDDLRFTVQADETLFLQPVTSNIVDLSVTYSHQFGKHVALRGRAGLAYWREARPGVVFFDSESTSGVSPVIGLGMDFGWRRVRAGLFADLYPSVGDTDYVVSYGVGMSFVFGSHDRAQ